MNKEEAFCQINLDVGILGEESCKISEKLETEQLTDLDARHCCISGWIVDTKESRNKNCTINRFPQTRERESNRHTNSLKSYSLLKTKVQDIRPESEFLHFEDSSDYIQFYRKEKFKRFDFAFKEPLTKAKRHERQTYSVQNTFSLSSGGKCELGRGDKLKINPSGIQGDKDPSLRMSRQSDCENNPLMLVITSKGLAEQPKTHRASNLPMTGYFAARRLQLRSNVKTDIRWKQQNGIKGNNKGTSGITACSQVKNRNPTTDGCNSTKGAGENIRELSHGVKHLEMNSQVTCTGRSHFRKPTPLRSKPSSSRMHRSSSVPQLEVCTTSVQFSQLGNVGADVSGKAVSSHRQTTPSVDYSQYMHMFKNVLDYYGQKKLQQKQNETDLQLQNLLSLRS